MRTVHRPPLRLVRNYLRELRRRHGPSDAVAWCDMPGKLNGWIADLEGDRLEVYLKIEGVPGLRDRKIRASGPRAEMYELVDWFEDKTGMTVNVPNRQRTGPKPIEGQMELTLAELQPEVTP